MDGGGGGGSGNTNRGGRVDKVAACTVSQKRLM